MEVRERMLVSAEGGNEQNFSVGEEGNKAECWCTGLVRDSMYVSVSG